MSDADQSRLAAGAQAVRASGVLGRSRLLLSLFDFLVARAADPRPPKESEIAYSVFGKSAGFETGQDAVVRVNIHRLRRKLEQYAPDADRARGYHLSLPKGEYRIVGIERGHPAAEAQAPSGAAEPTRESPVPAAGHIWSGRRLTALVIAVLALNLGVVGWLAWGRGGAAAQAADSPMWRTFVHSRFPLLLVVGDYYIFGESDDGMEVARLVREYAVNSPEDLSLFQMQHPERPDRYVDLGLSYTPTAAPAALADIAPLFAGRKDSRVIMASSLTPEMMKTHDIVYVGYFSGLGALRGAALTGSRFQIGADFDELIDTVTRRHYISQAATGPAHGGLYRDYGYVAVIPGPAGNHIAILAGNRDIGAMAAAEQVSDPDTLRALQSATHKAESFEALYEVEGQGDVNFQSRLLTATPRKPPQDWAPDG